MNRLHDAFKILEMEPGASLEDVQRKYKLLSFVWHEDSLPDSRKHESKDKLKVLKYARDILVDHFKSDHKERNCLCQATNEDATEEPDTENAPEEATKPQSNDPLRDEDKTSEEVQEDEIDFEPAIDSEEQKKNSKLLKPALSLFAFTCVAGSINLAMASQKSASLKEFVPVSETKYEQKIQAFLKDKKNYLKTHLGKEAISYHPSLIQPYEKSIERIKRMNSASSYSTIQKSEFDTDNQKLTYKENWEIDSLTSHYKNKIAVEKSIDLIRHQLTLTNRALNNASSEPEILMLKKTGEKLKFLLEARIKRAASLKSKILEVEDLIIRKKGEGFLPKFPDPDKIEPAKIYNNFESLMQNYPHLFQ